MSSDDCVAILSSKIYPNMEAREYRVCWAQAIENIQRSDRAMISYFENSPIFDDYKSALVYANLLERKYGPTEYGVVIATPKDEKTWDEMLAGKRYKEKT